MASSVWIGPDLSEQINPSSVPAKGTTGLSGCCGARDDNQNGNKREVIQKDEDSSF